MDQPGCSYWHPFIFAAALSLGNDWGSGFSCSWMSIVLDLELEQHRGILLEGGLSHEIEEPGSDAAGF